MLKNMWLAYSLLKHREFQISFEKTVAGKAIQQYLSLEFRDDNFKHIAGFHKLKLNSMKDAKRIPEMIRTERLSYHSVASSPKFETFLRRATASELIGLGLVMKDCFVNLYEYVKPEWSKLNADFLLHLRIGAYDYYLFLKSISKVNNSPGSIYKCRPVSFFRNEPKYSEQKRYELHQTRLRLQSVVEKVGGIEKQII
ncbi:PBECR4 domain-containing protein [Streptococcus loxodontisalivarius]|uniref:Phage-Barnase-EndoU-ColicinE5/D-RelE like nuclease 4 domain-containing protein n=1 Tax=Streptococcus loxodontisalivarius TaxID=1349415 RepID=A0ABS2PR76_9STRE|nr:PBECR4 domain-containing protein [Streptococcus loxodontisalivarius]MBM7642045.1 hypothetical protein [Streptococcus loxodontisalivarius]